MFEKIKQENLQNNNKKIHKDYIYKQTTLQNEHLVPIPVFTVSLSNQAASTRTQIPSKYDFPPFGFYKTRHKYYKHISTQTDL